MIKELCEDGEAADAAGEKHASPVEGPEPSCPGSTPGASPYDAAIDKYIAASGQEHLFQPVIAALCDGSSRLISTGIHHDIVLIALTGTIAGLLGVLREKGATRLELLALLARSFVYEAGFKDVDLIPREE